MNTGDELKPNEEKLAPADSSIAPMLRTDGPELITATELNTWADRDDAKTVFPELMRRLLADTPGISNLEVRANEGVAAPGWDGTATSAGSVNLPAGELRFEFGTGADSIKKGSERLRQTCALAPGGHEFSIHFRHAAELGSW